MPKSTFSTTGDPPRLDGQFGDPMTPLEVKGQKRGMHISVLFPEYLYRFFLMVFPKTEDFGTVIC